jgi:hypothetical protein
VIPTFSRLSRFIASGIALRAAVAALGLFMVASSGCSDSNKATATPVLTTLNVTVRAATISMGQVDTAAAAGVDQNGAAIDAGTVTWTSSSSAIATVSASGVVTGAAAGSVQITATSGSVTGQETVSVTAPAGIKINEVESNGGTPGDWVELYNPTAASVDVSGWIVKDDDDTHIYKIPAGTTIAAGGYLVTEEAGFGFGLGAPDAARLFSPFNVLVDSYSWTTHATTTYGRCPNGTGAFTTTVASTKGAANSCTGSGAGTGTTAAAWPGGAGIATIDGMSVFGGNLSGLAYEPASGPTPAVIWGARNGPGSLFRLVFNGTIWTPDSTNGWAAGKALHYPNGQGEPDAEGVTFAAGGSAGGMYVSAERDNSNNAVSRNSVLRYDASAGGTSLIATNEWNLTADLPVTGANLGAEAVTWLPDTFLVARGFFDETAGHAYNPLEYANHGSGLFFVGLEGTGGVYVYALDQTGSAFKRIATIATGFPSVMDLAFDRELGNLWGVCDDGCNGQSAILEIDASASSATKGRFHVTHLFDRPTGMPNYNNEGFTVAPQSECVNGVKPAYWADDAEDNGHAIRKGSVTCNAFTSASSVRRP